MKINTCSICTMFEAMQLKWLGPMMLTIGAILAALSMVAWPLLFVWPVMIAVGIGLAAGHGACTECHIST